MAEKNVVEKLDCLIACCDPELHVELQLDPSSQAMATLTAISADIWGKIQVLTARYLKSVQVIEVFLFYSI